MNCARAWWAIGRASCGRRRGEKALFRRNHYEAMRRQVVFPSILVRMVVMGETTGQPRCGPGERRRLLQPDYSRRIKKILPSWSRR